MTSPAPTPATPPTRPTRPLPPARRTPRATTSPASPPSPRSPSQRPAATSRAITVGTVAWLVVLAAVTVVQLGRHAWADSAVLLAALVVLLADLTGRLPHGTFAIAHTGPVVIGAAVLAGLVLFLAPRHGTVAGFAVVGAGVGALVYAWPERADDDPALDTRQVWDRPTSRTAAAWTAAWVAGCLWELTMFLLGGTEHDGRDLYPAASDLLDPLLDHPLVKALFVLLWLTVGVGLLARTDRR